MLNPVTDTELDTLYALIAAKFPDNSSGVILPADARQVLASMVEDSRKAKVRLDALTTNQVKGSVFRVPNVERVNGVPTVPTALIDPRFRIVGMEALAENGVDAGEAQAGLRADPITFQLIAHSSGTVNALVNALPATTQTVKAHWVRTSGTEAEKIITYPVLELEDHPYQRSEVVQYTFLSGQTILVAWRDDSVGFSHPLPTGLDSDPIYLPFAPLAAPPAFRPLRFGEVPANAQGIVGLELQQAIIWLANHLGSGASLPEGVVFDVAIGDDAVIFDSATAQ